MAEHSISYVTHHDGNSQVLTVRWDGSQYLATVASQTYTEPLDGLVKVVDAHPALIVAQRAAGRFLWATFHRLTAEYVEQWERGFFATD